MKKQTTKWLKIYANPVSDKRLVSGIQKELAKLNSKKINSPIRKYATYMKVYLNEEGIQMADKHIQNTQYHCYQQGNAN